MIRKRQLLLNATTSAVQVVITAGCFFFLYRYLLESIGAEDFGVWAVVLSTTAASSIANLGLANSTTKFVSQYLARNDRDHVGRIVQTAAISTAAVLSLALLAAYPILSKVLAFVIEPAHNLAAARAVLPYALLSFWLASVSLVFQSSIDGFQRIDLRTGLLSAAAVVYLALALLLVPRSGLIGLAQAQVLQAALLLIASWTILKKLLSRLPLLPYQWNGSTFRELIGYSLNFQAISITQMLYEPITTALISRFGGVGMAAYYEMARRMVTQLRALFVTAHQSIVPTIADLQERNPQLINNIYTRSLQLLGYLIIPSLPLFIVLTPLVSRVWIGHHEPVFIAMANVLFVGWFLNMASNPAYFANLGTGDLRWNVIGHVVIAVLNLVLGLILGTLYGGIGVVVAFMAALLIGSATIAAAYHYRHRVRPADLLDYESVILAFTSLLAMSGCLYLYYRFAPSLAISTLSALMVAVYGAVVVLPLWKHPVRLRLLAWISGALSQNQESSQTHL